MSAEGKFSGHPGVLIDDCNDGRLEEAHTAGWVLHEVFREVKDRSAIQRYSSIFSNADQHTLFVRTGISVAKDAKKLYLERHPASGVEITVHLSHHFPPTTDEWPKEDIKGTPSGSLVFCLRDSKELGAWPTYTPPLTLSLMVDTAKLVLEKVKESSTSTDIPMRLKMVALQLKDRGMLENISIFVVDEATFKQAKDTRILPSHEYQIY